MKTIETWEYIGLFLDKETKNKLRDIALNSKYGDLLKNAKKEYIDHCTLLHCTDFCKPEGNPLMHYLNSLIKKGFTKYKLRIDAIGVSDKAMAFKVCTEIDKKQKPSIYCYRDTPHITICTFEGGKPVDSNNITEWHYFEKPLIIETTLKKKYNG